MDINLLIKITLKNLKVDHPTNHQLEFIMINYNFQIFKKKRINYKNIRQNKIKTRIKTAKLFYKQNVNNLINISSYILLILTD